MATTDPTDRSQAGIAAHWLTPRTARRRRERGACTVAGCDRLQHGHGYCLAHLRHVQQGQAPRQIRRCEKHDGCSVPGCERPHQTRGLCELHYWRVYRGGWATPERKEP